MAQEAALAAREAAAAARERARAAAAAAAQKRRVAMDGLLINWKTMSQRERVLEMQVALADGMVQSQMKAARVRRVLPSEVTSTDVRGCACAVCGCACDVCGEGWGWGRGLRLVEETHFVGLNAPCDPVCPPCLIVPLCHGYPPSPIRV